MQTITLTNEQAITLVGLLTSFFKSRVLTRLERNTIYKVQEQVGGPNYPAPPTPPRHMGVPANIAPARHAQGNIRKPT